MDIPHKIHVKLGDSEFMAEGSETTVKEQFDRFLDALSKFTADPKTKQPPVLDTSKSAQPPGEMKLLDQNLMDRVYRQDDRVGLSLRVRPSTATQIADAILLLLYGYVTIKGEHDVLAARLTKSMSQTGLTFDRVDRVMASASYDGLITETGQRGGKRYGLNNAGLAKAQELLGGILS